jgi:hypothetical protein
MLNRRALAITAITVSAILVLIAVLVTIQMFLGPRIDVSLIVNGLAAMGSFTASVVALWIANSDRRQRKFERRAAEEAQAGWWSLSPRDQQRNRSYKCLSRTSARTQCST